MNKYMLIFALFPVLTFSSNGRGRSNTLGSSDRHVSNLPGRRAQSQQPRGGHDFRVAARAVMAAETIARQSRSAEYITTAAAASEPMCILASELETRLQNPVFRGVDVEAVKKAVLEVGDLLYPKTLFAIVRNNVEPAKIRDALAVLSGPDFKKVMAAPSIASYFLKKRLDASSRNMTASAQSAAREAADRRATAAAGTSGLSYDASSPDSRRAMIERVKAQYREDQTPSPDSKK